MLFKNGKKIRCKEINHSVGGLSGWKKCIQTNLKPDIDVLLIEN